METETQLAFEGTKEQQEIAARAFEVMKRKGMLFGANAPIKMNADAIVKALTKEGGAMPGRSAAELTPRVISALEKNPAVFGREATGDFVTTKSGHAPGHAPGTQGGDQNAHTFKQRLNTEATKLDAGASREYAETLVTRAAEREAFIDTLADLPAPPSPRNTPHLPPQPPKRVEFQTLIPAHLLPPPPVVVQPEEEEEPVQAAPPTPQRSQEPAAPVPTTPSTPATTAAAATVAPTGTPPVPAPTQPQAAAPSAQSAPAAEASASTTEAPARRPEETVAPAPRPAGAAPATPTAPPAATPTGPAAGPRPQTPPTRTEQPAQPTEARPAAATTQPAVEAPVARPKPAPAAPPAAPAAPVITGPVEVTLQTASGPVTFDLTAPVDEIVENEAVVTALEAALGSMLENDTRIVRFGSEIFVEEATERFSKGDFRRIREYLEEPETGGVASDRDIMTDVMGRRAEHPDYDRARFSLNTKLLREKKDFEFVGVDSDRLWIIANSSPVSHPVRKPAEIGQDYRYLEDPAIQSVEEEGETNGAAPYEHSLTYYEYENGVLPYDRRFKRIFPGAVFEDQRSSLIRFEIPQLYGALIAELRYPTGNRGGYIMGLNELFTDHLVPGARFQIVPTDRGEDVFEVRYTTIKEREENLLQLDERRGRYVFRPVSYSVETDPAMLMTETKFGKLHNQKKLDESERKKPDVIIINAFEAVGEELDGKPWALFDDIFPVVNVERPISRSWLKTLLSGAYPYFYADENNEGAYFYDPSKKPA